MMKLRKTTYPLLTLTAALCLLSACIEEFEADIPADDSELLVVEGTICAGRMNRFALSRTQAVSADDAPHLVTGATVAVRGTDGSDRPAIFTEGFYTCMIDRLDPDVEYFLHIETDGEVYESEPQRPLPTEGIADVRGVQDTPESSIDVIVTPEAPLRSDQANYYLWTYDETWMVTPDCMTAMYYDTTRREPVYEDIYHFPRQGWVDATGAVTTVGASTGYDRQHIQGLKVYDIERNDERMYHRYSALLHQRAISKGEYEYELARRQASAEMGGLFTPLPSALPTNIRCLTSGKHVIGFVGCSLNITDYRLFLTPGDFSIRYPMATDHRLWLEDPKADDCCDMVARGYYLCEWVVPELSPTGKLRSAWAQIHQLDVRYRHKGVYVEEPEFWNEGDTE